MIPNSVITDIINGDIILFLGAGASTEGITYFQKKLSKRLSDNCNYPDDAPFSLPHIADYYCDILDGGFKSRLVREIREYLDMYMDNSDAYRIVTRNHKIISKIGFFKHIITTNWDVFLERELKIIPIVRDKDLVYWKDDKRQLIKMHGCISQPDTMTITVKDYTEFIENRIDEPISNKIKDFMTTKIILFVGYSLNDENFNLIHDKILNKMGDFSRTSYAIMRKPSEEDVSKWREKGIIILPYDAYDFFNDIYKKLIERGFYFNYHNIIKIKNKCSIVNGIYTDTLINNDEMSRICSLYQMGIIHSLENVLEDINNGREINKIKNKISIEEIEVKKWVNRHNPNEISYCKGRLEALKWVFNEGCELELYLDWDFNPVNKAIYEDL